MFVTQLLPYDDHVYFKCVACIVSCTVSVLFLVWTLATYYHFRVTLGTSLNKLLMMVLVALLAQVLEKMFFATFTIANEGLPAWMCDFNGSLDQFLDATSTCLLIAFFIGMSDLRHYWGVDENLWRPKLIAVLVGALSVAICWVFLGRREYVEGQRPSHFSQSLAWCWIPNSPQGLTLINSTDGMNGLKFGCGYLLDLLMACVALYAYVVQRRRPTESSWMGKKIVILRFCGTCIFPVVVYILGMVVRLGADVEKNEMEIIMCSVFPLLGAAESCVFLITEKCFLALISRRDRVVGVLSRDGFTNVLRTMLCDSVVGYHFSSNREYGRSLIESTSTTARYFQETEEMIAAGHDGKLVQSLSPSMANFVIQVDDCSTRESCPGNQKLSRDEGGDEARSEGLSSVWNNPPPTRVQTRSSGPQRLSSLSSSFSSSTRD